MRHRHLELGALVEIRPAYSMVSRQEDSHDEWTGCEAEVLEICRDGDVLVHVKAVGAVYFHPRRLKRLRGAS